MRHSVLKELTVRKFADIQKESCCTAFWMWAIFEWKLRGEIYEIHVNRNMYAQADVLRLPIKHQSQRTAWSFESVTNKPTLFFVLLRMCRGKVTTERQVYAPTRRRNCLATTATKCFPFVFHRAITNSCAINTQNLALISASELRCATYCMYRQNMVTTTVSGRASYIHEKSASDSCRHYQICVSGTVLSGRLGESE